MFSQNSTVVYTHLFAGQNVYPDVPVVVDLVDGGAEGVALVLSHGQDDGDSAQGEGGSKKLLFCHGKKKVRI